MGLSDDGFVEGVKYGYGWHTNEQGRVVVYRYPIVGSGEVIGGFKSRSLPMNWDNIKVQSCACQLFPDKLTSSHRAMVEFLLNATEEELESALFMNVINQGD